MNIIRLSEPKVSWFPRAKAREGNEEFSGHRNKNRLIRGRRCWRSAVFSALKGPCAAISHFLFNFPAIGTVKSRSYVFQRERGKIRISEYGENCIVFPPGNEKKNNKKTYPIIRTVGRKSHDPCFRLLLMEVGVITYVAQRINELLLYFALHHLPTKQKSYSVPFCDFFRQILFPLFFIFKKFSEVLPLINF